MTKVVYVGLGSNIGHREAALRRAISLMESYDLRVRRVSSVYETAPMYKEDQGKFLNAVVELATNLFPMRLLLRLQGIERRMGRHRTIRNGPRTIDIDILLFGSNVIETDTLRIPHPGMLERRFVLEPLSELAPDALHPVAKHTIRELLASVPPGGVRKTDIQLATPKS